MDLLRDLYGHAPTPVLVVGVFYWVFCLAASYLTYIDARHYRIGPNPQEVSRLGRSLKPGETAAVVLWLGFIGLLEYLRTRKEMIALAANYPCDESGIFVYVISLVLFIPSLPAFVIMGSI
jgi:hypothetical protein